mmetsp:Transcript_74597/g.218697  ORF Transcript_74597/g.218697 Transcript_74597/m.218697 type:complete len:89 (-) Transcript_74597:377-643(-)
MPQPGCILAFGGVASLWAHQKALLLQQSRRPPDDAGCGFHCQANPVKVLKQPPHSIYDCRALSPSPFSLQPPLALAANSTNSVQTYFF